MRTLQQELAEKLSTKLPNEGSKILSGTLDILSCRHSMSEETRHKKTMSKKGIKEKFKPRKCRNSRTVITYSRKGDNIMTKTSNDRKHFLVKLVEWVIKHPGKRHKEIAEAMEHFQPGGKGTVANVVRNFLSDVVKCTGENPLFYTEKGTYYVAEGTNADEVVTLYLQNINNLRKANYKRALANKSKSLQNAETPSMGIPGVQGVPCEQDVVSITTLNMKDIFQLLEMGAEVHLIIKRGDNYGKKN